MNSADFVKLATDFVLRDSGNVISADFALRADLAGVRMFDAPLLGFGDAKDAYFARLKEKDVIGPHFKLPEEWLESADTVISIFLPASAAVRNDNKTAMDWPSPGWMHARIEGQAMITRLNRYLQEALKNAGYAALAPFLDERFYSREIPSDNPDTQPFFTSNWSERHAAFICGLGTFGLSKGLITEKGVAGRFTSIITNLHLPRTARGYTDIYENCSMCGACVKNCPAGAISPQTGKDHYKCSEYLEITKIKFKPRYGCGKCQVKVPCETRPCRGAR